MTNIFHEEIKNEKLSFLINNSPIYKKAAIGECDFIIHNELLWSTKEKETEKILKAVSKKYGLIDRFVIIFIVTDDDIKYKYYHNLILVRASIKASSKRSNELVMPFIWECLDAPFLTISNIDKPDIGFCGLTGIFRKNILNVFQQSKAVNCNFIIRENFWGGAPHDPVVVSTYNNNLRENPFIIAQRGNGNFSMRFYQTLAAGRIPVLVNTDMALPFQDIIDWQKYIVFENNENSCLEKVIDVFENGEYVKMQENCSNIFKSYFSSQNFLEQLIKQIFRMFP